MTSDYALILTDPDEGDLLGIWGPYTSQADAEQARTELITWPMQPGGWEVVALKKFTHPALAAADFFSEPRPEPGA